MNSKREAMINITNAKVFQGTETKFLRWVDGLGAHCALVSSKNSFKAPYIHVITFNVHIGL